MFYVHRVEETVACLLQRRNGGTQISLQSNVLLIDPQDIGQVFPELRPRGVAQDAATLGAAGRPASGPVSP